MIQVVSEIDQYFADTLNKDNNFIEPLEWWSSNHVKYPHIFKVAKKYLAIPTTSLSSERVWSNAGFIINRLRNGLSTARSLNLCLS